MNEQPGPQNNNKKPEKKNFYFHYLQVSILVRGSIFQGCEATKIAKNKV